MVVDYHQFQTYNTVLILTVNVTLCLVVMLAACICCTKKKVPKNELLGLEGMVKMKNPDDVIIVTTVRASESQADLNSSTISNADSDKRASTAAHRSLPDIPVGDGNGDNGSELYETVADKRLMDAQNSTEKSPAPSLKKQISVSQHSSISQADDVSSPYSRVKNNPHDYAKLRSTEHPYAQLNAPSTSTSAASTVTTAATSSSQVSSSPNQLATHAESLNRISQHSDSLSQTHDTAAPQAEIPAASAIAGMISASQDLPYMTPPIGNQHFSGDSQDSSKGYTSISVREPLANILAQQPPKAMPNRAGQMSRDTNDSHYATVSDDSDETYAAIEDPNGRIHPNVATDIYTSGSETYAQIQPMQPGNPIVVSVEINSTGGLSRQTDGPSDRGSQLLEVSGSSAANSSAASTTNNLSHMSGAASSSTASQQQSTERTGRPASEGHMQAMQSAHVDSLRAQMHSRQASCSSNNSSSMGNLGSPKPEKRQANSPLPPTPKSSTLPASSNSSLTSGRNSVISVIESGVALLDMGVGGGGNLSATSSSSVAMAGAAANTETSPQKLKTKSLSPSKDIEGMYAKVMKKNKFSRHSPSSQNSSPVMIRKNDPAGVSAAYLGVSPLDSAAAELIDTHKITIGSTATTLNEKAGGRLRSNSYNAKDHGYETIPADAMRQKAGQAATAAAGDHRKSECYTSVLKKEIEAVGGGPGGGSTTIALGQLRVNDEKYYETIAGASSSPAAVLLTSTSSKTTLSLLNNSDPGYETLHKDCSGDLDLEDHEKKSSDYDPNYEVLKTNVAGLSDDGYAKVVEKKRLHIDEEDATDGYSKVKGDDVDDGGNGGGYSTIRDAAERLSGADGDLAADANHNYASILETKGGGAGAHSESESDHYARIAEGRPHKTPDALPLNLVASTGGVETTSPTLPITSPSSINSASLFMSSSTPVSSSTNMTSTTSASTMSSRPTPTSSSQYESLTGSDTDPNYESVCYLNTSGRENPYERLPTEYSDTQLSSSSPLTSTTDDEAKRKAPNGTKAKAPEAGHHGGDVVVDDYFQV